MSASLEAWRRDDSVDQKDHPTNDFNLTVTTGDDALSRAALLNTYWLQIGKADRFKSEDDIKTGTDPMAMPNFPVPRFPYRRPDQARVPRDYLRKNLFGRWGREFTVHDRHRNRHYKRTKTSLTFWDAPSFATQVSKEYPIVVQTFSAFLVVLGELVYEVDWKVRTDWNGGRPTTEVFDVAGSIPKSVPASLKAKKLYRGTG